jgi:hypothetical protein
MAESTTRTDPAQKPNEPHNMSSEYTIEIATANSNNVLWPMTRQLLRGRWSRSVLVGVHAGPALQQMPDIPGLRLSVNLRTRTTRIFDPLGLPENASLLREVKIRYKELMGQEGRPEDDVKNEWPASDRDRGEGDSMLKGWLFWMKRLVQAKEAVEIGAPLPSFEQIEKLPGKTLVKPFDNSATTWKYAEEPSKEEKRALEFALGAL